MLSFAFQSEFSSLLDGIIIHQLEYTSVLEHFKHSQQLKTDLQFLWCLIASEDHFIDFIANDFRSRDQLWVGFQLI